MNVREMDGRVRLAILEEFLSERTPTVETVASALGLGAEDVRSAFDRLATGRAIVLVEGTHDIRMAAPFAATRSDFHVRTSTQSCYANCVWDAVGVSALLAGAGRPSDVDVHTSCADCAEPLTLRVRKGTLTADPVDAVAHFAVPASHWWDDIVFT